jgi:hypothetical protein
MPHFMASCNYSAESKNALIANPVDRAKAASAAVEAVGGKLHSALFCYIRSTQHNCVRGTCYDASGLRRVLVD